jgi:hypothetical protein
MLIFTEVLFFNPKSKIKLVNENFHGNPAVENGSADSGGVVVDSCLGS